MAKKYTKKQVKKLTDLDSSDGPKIDNHFHPIENITEGNNSLPGKHGVDSDRERVLPPTRKQKRYSNQQLIKLRDPICCFCGESDYSLLDAHRIVEGGVYHDRNCVVCCSLCHRKIHSGRIKILGKHPSTGPKLFCVHCIIDGEEKWL